ncbi:MAG: glutamate--cysteine ligase [Burkholderiaceae bacterium]
MTDLESRLNVLSPESLRGLSRGIEKESLRTRPDGMLADTPHPAGLGSALTHPNITTDFSESQLELITGVHADADACVDEITAIHQYVHSQLDGELLWAASMPCGLPDDDVIPLGRYGSSNVGRAKTIYRQGLAHRYGRRMQTISGIHYNFSLPDSAWRALMTAPAGASVTGQGSEDLRAARSTGYFSLIRNFRRQSWLLLYLFGASPAVCHTFVAGRKHGLQALSGSTLYLPYATSLRMGPLGYQSDAQASIAASFNCLDSYAASLRRALSEPYPPYEAIGIDAGGGRYRQLATTLLQIENEFYGTIRPKRTTFSGERPLHALAERGVEYVEVRCIDLDPFEAVGIDAATMRFLDVFLLHCLLADSPPDSPDESADNAWNQHRVAQHGRDPALSLRRRNDDGTGPREVGARQWGLEMLAECQPIAAALDAASGNGARHAEALASARERLHDASSTPSARMLAAMADGYGDSFSGFILETSQRHREALLALPLDDARRRRFEQLAAASIAEQQAIEAADSMPFEEYRQRYLAGTLPIIAKAA